MKTKTIQSLAILTSLTLSACDESPKSQAKPDASSPTATATPPTAPGNRAVKLGEYTMKVPGVLEPWSDKEIAALHKSIEGSMGEIYQRYNQSKIPVGALSVTAMQSPDKEVTLLVMIMQLPRQEGLFAQLRGEAADKAKWGIQQGFITRASKTVAIEKKDYEGFYLTMAHADKSLDSVAGLMHKDHQGQMVNIQLKASVASKWTEAQLEKRLLEITESLQLK